MIRITKNKHTYSYYCRRCRIDHMFKYGEKENTSPCGLRHYGIESDSKVKHLNKRIVTGCLWIFDNYTAYDTSCGNAFCFLSDLETEMKSGFIYCPYCGKKITRIEQ